MKMQKIISIKEIKPNDILLIFDYSGQVRGMDKVKDINYENGKYDYINQEGKNYQGNISRYLESSRVYIVDENIYKYNDSRYKDTFPRMHDVFENIYGEHLGNHISSHILSSSFTDFQKRMDLIDFVEEFEDELHKIRFEDDEEITYRTKEELFAAKKAIQNELNNKSFFKLKV